MATWEERVNAAFGPSGYEDHMRRSLQTLILYEANRCIADALPTLRPFQRKLAYVDMAKALVNSLNGLNASQKLEVLWRTGTSKEPMNADTAWKRRKLLTKEVGTIKTAVASLLTGRTHEEALDAFIQQQYASVTGNVTPAPPNWFYAHNNAILCYKVYYRGGVPDPTFPPPNPPKALYVAEEKPAAMPSSPSITAKSTSGVPVVACFPGQAKVVATVIPENKTDPTTPEARKLMLQEVREHLELLKEFEGVISEEDLAKRKRDLFLAMPPVPPPLSIKRTKKEL